MNSNSIDLWAESFASQDETQFFNTIRLYLGEVKTPYNKQKLTAQLATFIRKPENTKAILSLLDEDDINLLTAVNLIPKACQQNLSDFFKNTYSFSEIYTMLCNLTDRLILYVTKDKYSGTEYFHINPLLKESLTPFMSLGTILPSPMVTEYSYADAFTLSPNFLAGFISYLKIQGCACKADGLIKKNDLNRLEAIFPGRAKCLQYLITAFINLNLVHEGPKTLILDTKRLESFVKFPELQQYAFLCAASVSRFSRDGLKKEAQLLLDSICAIPVHGYTRNTILRLAFLTGTYTEDGSAIAAQGRFSKMLEQARAASDSESMQNANLLDRMIDSAIEFGLLQNSGKTENGEEVYVKGEIQQSVGANAGEYPKVLNIESTFSVTLMPGLSLQVLLPLTDFLSIKKCGVVTEFEISKNSASYSFDNDWNPDSMYKQLEQFTYYELPQNLKINISDWYTSYSSAILYHGYVLKVSEKNINLTENNPKIAKYIKEKLAEGIYLLNVPVDADVSTFISESGLDFMGTVKNPSTQNEVLSLPQLRPAKPMSLAANADGTEPLKTSIQEADTLLVNLKKHLAEMDVPANTKESLSHRIANRLIISEQQLEIASIRLEILEADGMDFNGKVHLIDTAIAKEDMLELQLPSPNVEGQFITIVGKALLLTKQPGEAIIRFQFEPGKEIENILISRITHVRRLRF